jgi:hypothetical protein
MNERERQLLQAEILVDRLARLSADSIWARRASGVRASLHKALSRLEAIGDVKPLEPLIELGFAILEKAAREVPDPRDKICEG